MDDRISCDACRPRAFRACYTLLFFALLAPLSCKQSYAAVKLHFETANGTKTPPITAELALTPAAHAMGLMYRKSLGESEGMLFIFPSEDARSFWMKNTYVELDIIYLSNDMRIVSIVHRAVPLTETSRPSAGPARYVVEVRGGKAAEWKLAPGDKMEVEGKLPGR